MADNEAKFTRRDMLRGVGRTASLISLGAVGAIAASDAIDEEYVWQIDPYKCTACGHCQTYCVLEPSAVKCVHNFEMCGYCTLCFGYYDTEISESVDSGVEKQLCPTDAIVREVVDKEAYSYTIKESLCVACARCVKGCTDSANGSLFLQIRHDRCLNCNQCRIAMACPAGALVRVPAKTPYILKTLGGGH